MSFSVESVEAWHHFIRKCAHFAEYAVLGATVAFAFGDRLQTARKIVVASLGISAFYAATDEIHQMFVPGRMGSVSDVILDSAGALAGIVIFLLIKGKKKAKLAE